MMTTITVPNVPPVAGMPITYARGLRFEDGSVLWLTLPPTTKPTDSGGLPQ